MYSLISLLFSLLLHCDTSANSGLDFCTQALDIIEACMYSDSKIVRDIASSRLPLLFCGSEKILPRILSIVKSGSTETIMPVMEAVSYFSERMENSPKCNNDIRISLLEAIGGLASLRNEQEGYFLLVLIINFDDKDYIIRVKAYEQLIRLAGSLYIFILILI